MALLLGAIVSSTDAAAVFAVLRALPLPQKVTGLLEAESGFNDAPTIILVLVFSTAAADLPDPAHILGNVVYQLVVGGLLGLLIGRLGAAALRHIALPATGLYPLATVGFGIIAFAAAGAVNASGIIAAYLAGLGRDRTPGRTRRRPPHRRHPPGLTSEGCGRLRTPATAPDGGHSDHPRRHHSRPPPRHRAPHRRRTAAHHHTGHPGVRRTAASRHRQARQTRPLVW